MDDKDIKNETRTIKRIIIIITLIRIIIITLIRIIITKIITLIIIIMIIIMKEK